MDECERFAELAWAPPSELTPEEEAEVAAHRETCAACAAEINDVDILRDVLVGGDGDEEEPPGPELLERVKSRLAQAAPAPTAEVLTIEELAQLLRVPVDEVYAHLGELPAFEFAGRVRFRRAAVERWIEEQEERWRSQALTANLRAG